MLVAVSIISLVLVFVLATITPINMGVLALAATFLIAAASGLSEDDVFGMFPGDIFMLIVGITLLFGIARANGTMSLFLQASLRLVRDRRWAIPWLMFIIAGILMSFGFVLAVTVLAPMAMTLARKYRVKPLLMGMMVSHGALGASLMPVTVYANVTNQMADKAGISLSPTEMILVPLVLNLAFAAVLYAVLGRDLFNPADALTQKSAETTTSEGAIGRRTNGGGTAVLEPTETTAIAELPDTLTLTPMRVVTLLSVVGLVVCAFLDINVGVAALVGSAILLLLSPKTAGQAMAEVGWGVVLLVCGVVTFMSVLTANDTVKTVADGAAGLGAPVVAILAILILVGVISAFASTVGTIGMALPLTLPLMSNGIAASGVVLAVATCSIIADVCPFSTNGAIVLAEGGQGGARARLQRQMLGYTGLVCILAALALWLVLVVPGTL